MVSQSNHSSAKGPFDKLRVSGYDFYCATANLEKVT